MDKANLEIRRAKEYRKKNAEEWVFKTVFFVLYTHLHHYVFLNEHWDPKIYLHTYILSKVSLKKEICFHFISNIKGMDEDKLDVANFLRIEKKMTMILEEICLKEKWLKQFI